MAERNQPLPGFLLPRRVVRWGGSVAVYGDGQSLHDRCRAMFRGRKQKSLTAQVVPL